MLTGLQMWINWYSNFIPFTPALKEMFTQVYFNFHMYMKELLFAAIISPVHTSCEEIPS